ncbi:MAG: gliding motility lipoprotein GldH [Chitinophagaceae bacterium]|nr:gliding motility lipoprotein GldH [Chitinophagaceae bacterium]MCW5904127.1 gliding motility lipoprotein GldH [Chitinophagaceae bacterium]
MKTKGIKLLSIFLLIMIAFTACNTLDVFEKTTFFNKHEWGSTNMPIATFEVKDTTALYNIFFVLRHEDAYRYKNIWIDITMQSPDTTITVKREFTLANNEKWLGTAMSDIIEHRIPFNNAPTKLLKGTYTFTLHQAMREDPLQYILNAGIRIEKK